MANERVVNLLVRVQRDKVAADMAQKMIADIRKEMVQLDRAAHGIASSIAPANVALRRLDDSALKQLSKSGRDAVDMMDALRRETLDANKALDKVAGKTDFKTQIRGLREENRIESMARSSLTSIVPGGGGAAGQAFMQFYDFMDALPEANITIRELGKRMLETGPITTKLTGAISQLPPGMAQTAAKAGLVAGSMTAMIGASVALAVAFKKAQDIINDSAQATQDFLEVNQRYAEIIATGTTKDVQEAIQKNMDRNKALEIEREKLQMLVDMADDTEGFAGALLDVNDALGVNLGGQEDAKNRLEEVNREISNNIDANRLLDQAMLRGATTAADLAERERELRAERAAFLDEELARFIKLGEVQDTWSSTQLKAEQDRLNRDIEAYEKQLALNETRIQDGEATAAKIAEIDRQIAGEQAALGEAAVAGNQDVIDFHQAQIDYWLDQKDQALEAIATGKEAVAQNEELHKSIQQASDSLKELDLAAPIIAAREAALAATEALLDSIDARTKSEMDAYRLIQTASSEQVQSQIDAIENEKDVLEEMRKEITADMEAGVISYEQAQFALAEIGKRTVELTQDAQGLSDVLSAVQLREWGEKFVEITKLTEEYLKSAAETQADRNRQMQQEDEDFAREQAKDQRKLNEDLLKIDQNYAQRRSELLKQITDIEDEYQKSVTEAAADYDKESLRRTEDHYRKLADIEKDMRAKVRDAAASLDARAVIAAQEQGKEALDDEQERFKQEEKYRAEDYKALLESLKQDRDEKLRAAQEGLRDLELKHQQERNSRLADYRQQQADAQAEFALKRQRQAEEWSREDSERDAHYQQQLADLNAANAANEATYAAHFTTITNMTNTALGGIATAVGNFFNGIASKVPTAPPSTGGAKPNLPTAYAAGGTPSPGSFGWVGEKGPELVQFQGYNRVFPNDFSMKQTLAPQIAMPMSIQIYTAGQTPLESLYEQTRLESRIHNAVQREFLAILKR